MICAYNECKKEFQPKTHNQKYCSDACCRTATNIKIKEKYYEDKARKQGKKRVCASPDCNNFLSRYNEKRICSDCQTKRERTSNKDVLEMLKNVSG